MKLNKLNLGCGRKLLNGYINVDKAGSPNIKHDLEEFPWPWENDSVEEILLDHVLEHLGKDTNIYLAIMKEMYRVCRAGAKIRIIVPHFRHHSFFDDPTHVRVITPMGLILFSKKSNLDWIAEGKSNSLLALETGVDFEFKGVTAKPSQHWYRLHPSNEVDVSLLKQESEIYNSLIEQLDIELKVLKP